MSRTISMSNKPPLGVLITLRLQELGKNQKWLAKDADINAIYLCAVMAGRANPTINYLRKIANSLGMDVKDLTNAFLSKD